MNSILIVSRFHPFAKKHLVESKVRKSGSTACLTTFDQEMKMHSMNLLEYDREQIMNQYYSKKGSEGVRKRRKLGVDALAPGNYSKVECATRIQSHDGPVASFSFTPDGEYIVSASSADGLHLWHLQRGYNLGIMIPTCFLGPDSLTHPLRKNQRKVPLIVTQPGSMKSASVWLGAQDLLGYALHGMGGRPNKFLTGHIDNVTAIASQDKSLNIITGGADGLLLAWGCPDTESEENDLYYK